MAEAGVKAAKAANANIVIGLGAAQCLARNRCVCLRLAATRAASHTEHCGSPASPGGGSAVDTGKAIAALITQPEVSRACSSSSIQAPRAAEASNALPQPAPNERRHTVVASQGLLHYMEVVGKGQPITNRPVPFIAIPTTAGTGSEARGSRQSLPWSCKQADKSAAG